jgi:hypothetical protein
MAKVSGFVPSHPSDLSNPAPFLQTELSLQKEQLQLKIIEIEDEAEKWQKEKDRIKVSSPRLPLLGPYPLVLPGRRQVWSLLRFQPAVTSHTSLFWIHPLSYSSLLSLD